MKEKYCKKCDSTKPIDNFNKSKISPDGFYWYCKECVKIKNAARTTSGFILNAF
jgi:hypothetical protein